MARGAPSTRFPLSDVHKSVIADYISKFEAEVHRVNPSFKPHCHALTIWKSNTVSEIFKLEAFKDIEQEIDEPLKEIKKAIEHKFTNHFNNYMKQSKQASSSQPSSMKTPTTSSLNATMKPSKPLRSFILFTNQIYARDLFAQENKEELKAAVDQARKEHPNLNAGGLRNKALSELWEKADKSVWELKALDFASDIYANQEEFPGLMMESLQNLASGKRLGSLMMKLSYAFRNEDDEIVSGIIYTGHDAVNDLALFSEMDGDDDYLKKWSTHADAYLPQKPLNDIPQNVDGVPLFPDINIALASPAQLSQILCDYITALWRFSFEKSGMCASPVPWSHLLTHGSDYFDIVSFALPVMLDDPKTYLVNPVDAFILAKYFSTQSIDYPFCFFAQGSTKTSAASFINMIPMVPSTSTSLDTPTETHPNSLVAVHVDSTGAVIQGYSCGVSGTKVTPSHIEATAMHSIKTKTIPLVASTATPTAVTPADGKSSTGTTPTADAQVHPDLNSMKKKRKGRTRKATSFSAPVGHNDGELELTAQAMADSSLTANSILEMQMTTPLAVNSAFNLTNATTVSGVPKPSKKKGPAKATPTSITAAITSTEQEESTSASAGNRRSSRKCKADEPAVDPLRTVGSKKKRHFWLTQDANGNFFDKDGNPADKDGNLLPQIVT